MQTQTISEVIEGIKAKMCDEYCKFPAVVHEMWLRDELETDKDKFMYLEEHYCNCCLLNRL